ncbi:hypothetical protein Hanom_Chr11g00969081 [Helianthus anomalus]
MCQALSASALCGSLLRTLGEIPSWGKSDIITGAKIIIYSIKHARILHVTQQRLKFCLAKFKLQN